MALYCHPLDVHILNGLCLDKTLGFCTVKLRHNYIDQNRKKHLKSKNTIVISKL